MAVAAARRRDGRVLLEGVHALKHALRFGADVQVVVTADRDGLEQLLRELAPDVLPLVRERLTVVSDTRWAQLTPRDLPSPALAVAATPRWSLEELWAARGRVVVLDRPRHLGNLGAAVRVAAAADAAGVIVIGDADPWHPTVVRGSAGLGFALPVMRLDALPAVPGRPLVALDPQGEPLHAAPLADDAVLLVGTERAGLDPRLRQLADETRSIEMRSGVSSLNLATAVAVALYAGRGGP